MECETTIHLAVDVLKEHFGVVVARVGQILLERGTLSLPELLLFARHADDPGEQPLAFQQVRNSLLVLVQHSIVHVEPIPQTGGYLQVYTIDTDEVLSRLRFPQFLEHVRLRHGPLAEELLRVVLQYGRVARGVVMKEACESARALKLEDAKLLLEMLVKERVLRPVESCSPGSLAGMLAAASPRRTATAATAEPAPLTLDAAELPQKRKADMVEGSEADGNGGANGSSLAAVDEATENDVDANGAMAAVDTQAVPDTAQRTQPGNTAAVSSSATKDPVYRYDRANLQLDLCKALLCRVVEERTSPQVAQVLSAVLTSALPESKRSGVMVNWLGFEAIDAKMNDWYPQEGRDPQRARVKLRTNLDLLASHKDSLLKKRVFQASMMKREAAQTEMAEWAVDWQNVRTLLTNCVQSQLVRDQFGTVGLRIFNLLKETSPPQRMEESQICNICMVAAEEGRKILHAMVRQSFVQWQQVSRSSDGAIANSYWLYYIDPKRAESTMEESALQAILNLRVRFRAENALVVPLESRVNSLTAKERATLRAGRRIEDILERSFLVLDIVPMVCRTGV